MAEKIQKTQAQQTLDELANEIQKAQKFQRETGLGANIAAGEVSKYLRNTEPKDYKLAELVKMYNEAIIGHSGFSKKAIAAGLEDSYLANSILKTIGAPTQGEIAQAINENPTNLLQILGSNKRTEENISSFALTESQKLISSQDYDSRVELLNEVGANIDSTRMAYDVQATANALLTYVGAGKDAVEVPIQYRNAARKAA